jgi:hypothetical protein
LNPRPKTVEPDHYMLSLACNLVRILKADKTNTDQLLGFHEKRRNARFSLAHVMTLETRKVGDSVKSVAGY